MPTEDENNSDDETTEEEGEETEDEIDYSILEDLFAEPVNDEESEIKRITHEEFLSYIQELIDEHPAANVEMESEVFFDFIWEMIWVYGDYLKYVKRGECVDPEYEIELFAEIGFDWDWKFQHDMR